MTSSSQLKSIVTMARPLIERWLDIGEQLAALRDAATAQGIEWQPIKALLKAQIQDEAENKGRVSKLLDRAETATAYADMLGWGEENKKNSPAPEAAHDPETGEITPDAVGSTRARGPLTEETPEPVAFGASPVTAGGRPPSPLAVADIELPDIPDFLRRGRNLAETVAA